MTFSSAKPSVDVCCSGLFSILDNKFPIPYINPLIELPANFLEMGNLFKTQFFMQSNIGFHRTVDYTLYGDTLTLVSRVFGIPVTDVFERER